MRRSLRNNRKLERCYIKPSTMIVQGHFPVSSKKDDGAEDDKASRNDYFNRLQDSCQSGEEKYDAAILTMAPAALGLSVTFIKDVVKLNDADWMWFLYGSWILLAISTLSVVLSFRLSSAAMQWAMKRMNDVWFQPYTVIRSELDENWRNVVTTGLNNLAGASFVVGLISMALFVALNVNLSKERSMKNANQQQGQLQQRGLTTPPMRPASSPTIPATLPTVQADTSRGSSSSPGNAVGKDKL